MATDAASAALEWISAQFGSLSGERILLALTISAAAFLAAQLFRTSIARLRKQFVNTAAFGYIVQQLGGYAIVFIGLVSAVATLGVNLSSLTIFGGAVGVGLGLGLQGVVKEFVSGLVLIFDPMVNVGDYVEVSGVRGEVVEIGPRATCIRTNDATHVIIPNAALVNSRVVNWTYNNSAPRIRVRFAVDGRSDTQRVREVVLAAARELPFTRADDRAHQTQVWLANFSASALEFELVVWPVEDSARHPSAMHAAYCWAIYHALLEAGIERSAQQMDLHLRGLFGRNDAEALGLLHLGGDPGEELGQGSEAPARPPNDAVGAVFQEAEERRRAMTEATRSSNRAARSG